MSNQRNWNKISENSWNTVKHKSNNKKPYISQKRQQNNEFN